MCLHKVLRNQHDNRKTTMNHEIITNKNLMQIDYARTERIAFLNNLSTNTQDRISFPARDLVAYPLYFSRPFQTTGDAETENVQVLNRSP